MAAESVEWNEVKDLVGQIASKIIDSGWRPDLIVALSRGGFIPAAMIALKLEVKNLVGLDVNKDEDGKRSLSHFAHLGDLSGQRVLCVDDSIITGRLLGLTAAAVQAKGGDPRTCALISEGICPPPAYLAKTRSATPTFPWE